MLQSPRHPVPPLLGSQKRRGTPLHRTTARREPRAGPAWLPGPSAQRSQPIAPPASVCVLLATAEPKAVQRGSRGSACDRGGKINIEIPARLTRLLQRELQPKTNSTYSVLACVPSPYVFLFTNDSGKLNVHMTFTGGPNVVTCEQCMLSSCLNPRYVCFFVVLQRPPYLMM